MVVFAMRFQSQERTTTLGKKSGSLFKEISERLMAIEAAKAKYQLSCSARST